jgi:glutaredoxin
MAAGLTGRWTARWAAWRTARGTGWLAAALLVAAVAAFLALGGAGQLRGLMDEEVTPAQVAALAGQVGPGEVMLYTADGCLYCDLAKVWLEQRAFAYTECNMNASSACAKAFHAYGARGTPFLVVRGEQMREGFQPAVFLTILRRRRA